MQFEEKSSIKMSDTNTYTYLTDILGECGCSVICILDSYQMSISCGRRYCPTTEW